MARSGNFRRPIPGRRKTQTPTPEKQGRPRWPVRIFPTSVRRHRHSFRPVRRSSRRPGFPTATAAPAAPAAAATAEGGPHIACQARVENLPFRSQRGGRRPDQRSGRPRTHTPLFPPCGDLPGRTVPQKLTAESLLGNVQPAEEPTFGRRCLRNGDRHRFEA